MTTTPQATLSHRDRAVLRAVAAGRCQISADIGIHLTIDGVCCCDQSVGVRLCQAGLIATDGSRPGLARLTPSGHAMLDAA